MRALIDIRFNVNQMNVTNVYHIWLSVWFVFSFPAAANAAVAKIRTFIASRAVVLPKDIPSF